MSLSSEYFYKLVEDTRKRVENSNQLSKEEKENVVVCGYGHIGDGNLHLNISIPGYKNDDL